ncbi:deoxyribodipyrimidine photo-lyase [Vibrio brasiliensis]|uniref:deoxyribodipyrimidine photo-lyase n=1 Tax=Vibrio brasiliensis TaxID=170652 RepID=UPI001EFDD709|nr:deoxyribodipyrimidine photo-lyase [Vibrio brasiliensis]MCG9647802.1 deoxyribodipyrimidine photo-lyase [Vibrio brasiliensis]
MKLVWLRRDLRIEDNRALCSAIESEQPVMALYIATPETWQRHGLAPIQADLLKRRLVTLQTDLATINVPLYYAQVDTYQQAAQLVAEIAKSNSLDGVYYNKEYEFDEQRRDARLQELLVHAGIAAHSFDDKCALQPGSVLNKQGHYFKVFTPFKRAYLTRFYQQPISIIRPQPIGEVAQLHGEQAQLFSDNSSFDYPTESSATYPVDTSSIINQLRDFVAHRSERYSDQRDIPSVEGTSRLSPYLAIGALSVRQCMARLHDQHPKPLPAGREMWMSELIWREFYQHLIYFESKLSKGNCFLEWGDRLSWRNSSADIDAWKKGQTGYPIVDAAMRQLNHTGWMHNRLRMVVASFLIKDLHVDWHVGERYFMSKLVDGDYAANNGGWQWCASTGCDGQPYFRIFNPVSQGERFDPDGEFVCQWIPELAAVPRKFIHQPWKWSKAKELSYPPPIVDHKTEREITLSLYKEAKGNVDGA